MAAERYLLGEMTPEDRDAFEDHFFGCAECATAVHDGATISAAIRIEKANRTRQPRRATPISWLAAAAAAVILVGMLAVQNINLRQQLKAAHTPHAVDSFSFLTAGSRGSEELTVNNGSRPFTIDFDIPPQPDAQRYIVEVVDAGSNVQVTDIVTAQAARDTQQIFFPGGSLRPGRYSFKVRAEPAGQPATAWSFVVH